MTVPIDPEHENPASGGGWISGPMNPPSVAHPTWCSPAHCTAANYGTHQSAPIVVRRNGSAVGRTEMSLQQSSAAGTYLVIVVEQYGPDPDNPEGTIGLRLTEARRVAERLTGLLALIGGDHG